MPKRFPVFWKALLLCCFFVFSAQLIQAQTIYYVSAGGNDANNGTAWNTAYRTVQQALAVAGSNSQIWVAAGTYYPDEMNGTNTNDRTASFVMKNNVAIYGGFAGTEILLTQRNWTTNSTILSGDIDQNTDATNNSYHVLKNDNNGLNNSAVLDGFTVTAGNANGVGNDGTGGGMFNNNSSPAITNCIFSANRAGGGGGLCNTSSAPILTNCSFTGNNANTGGGLFNINTSNPTLVNCSFSGNSASSYGGGIANISSSPAITKCTVINNSASDGGGISNTSSTSPVITNCLITRNTATQGGGIKNENSTVQVTNCGFLGNKAMTGAGIHNSSSPTSLINCSFSGNNGTFGGGGMYNNSSNSTITNCIFWGDGGSEIQNASSTPTITYSLIQGLNPAGTGNLDGTNAGNNPLFVQQPDYNSAPTSTGNLRLKATSPAIAKGNNAANNIATDLDGNNRLIGTIDLGAYEFFSNNPYVSSIKKGGGSYDFIVTFNKPVTGVDLSDFVLTTTSISMSNASLQTISGSGNTYTVTAKLGSNGTARLDFISDGSVTDQNGNAANANYTSGEVWSFSASPLGFDVGPMNPTSFTFPTCSSIASGNVGFNGSASPSNVFTVQLSDRFGNFDNPRTIGSLASPGSTINFTLSGAWMVSSSNYKIRVASSNPVLIGDNIISFSVTAVQNCSLTVDSDFFRTKQSGNWDNVSTWESSHDGAVWTSATAVPTSLTAGIEIGAGHTVSITTPVSMNHVSVKGSLSLFNTEPVVSGTKGRITLTNPGVGNYAMQIFSGGKLTVASESKTYSYILSYNGGNVLVEKGGRIVIGDGINGTADEYHRFATGPSSEVAWKNSAIFEWDSPAGIGPKGGITYFPTNPDFGYVRPVFRLSHIPPGSFSDPGTTTVNGSLEVVDTFLYSLSIPVIKTIGMKVEAAATLSLNNVNIVNESVITGDGTIELSGSGVSTIRSGPISSKIKLVNKQVRLSGNLFADSLELTGNSRLLLDSFNLNVGLAPVVGDSANFVVTNGSGTLTRNVTGSPVLFHVGADSSSYTPAVLTNTGSATDIRVRVGKGVENTNSNSTGNVDRTWFVNATEAGANLLVGLQWNAADEQSLFNRAIAGISQGHKCKPPPNCDDTYYDRAIRTPVSGTGPYSISRANIMEPTSFIVKSNPDVFTFTGFGSWDDPNNWTPGIVPPKVIPNGTEIRINPPAGNQCVINGDLTIQPGGKLTVMQDKVLVVNGKIIVQ